MVKKIKFELKCLTSIDHDYILRDTVEAVKHFHWDTIYLKFLKVTPTLMAFLNGLIKKFM